MVGIAVMTWLFCGSNYGQTLQAYALQKVLNKLGHKNVYFQNIDSEYWHLYNNPHKEPLKIKPEDLFRGDVNGNSIILRNRVFDIFNRKNFSFLDGYEKADMETSMIEKRCSVVICGADQIWNPTYHNPEYRHDSGMYVADFDDVKGFTAISYAPSIGTNVIYEENKDLFKEFARRINTFDAVSVREESAKRLLQEEWKEDKLPEKDVSVVLDPAFLLAKDEWISLVKTDNKYIEFAKSNTGYILCYLLGDPSEQVTIVKQIAKERNQTIRWVVMDDEIEGEDNIELLSGLSPLEFVWEISGADYVIGNSYHAAVFSILFNKQFVMLPRDYKKEWFCSGEARMEQLYRTFGIGNRSVQSLNEFNALVPIDFEFVEKRLIDEREKSLFFLKNALYKPAEDALIRQYEERRDFYFSFPHEEIKRTEKIIIYGAGDVGYHYYCQCKLFGYAKVELWVDRKKTNCEGVRVDPVYQDYENIEYDRIVIANSSDKQRDEIKNYLLSQNVSEEKIYSKPPILN